MNRVVVGTIAVLSLLSAYAVRPDAPRLTLGVVSDVHLRCPETGFDEQGVDVVDFRKALRAFRAAGVDGVVISGDLASGGRRCDLESGPLPWSELGDENGDTPKGDAKRKLLPPHVQYRNVQGLVLRVYDDRLVIERRRFDETDRIGPDWIVPIPAGSSDFSSRRQLSVPRFAASARAALRRHRADGCASRFRTWRRRGASRRCIQRLTSLTWCTCAHFTRVHGI